MRNTPIEVARINLEHAASEGLRVISSAAELASKVIAQSASDAVRVLSEAAMTSAKVVSESATVAAKTVAVRDDSDHEAIIRIEGHIAGLEKSMKSLEDSEAQKKSNPAFTVAHEQRITSLENSKGIQVILTSIGTAILGVLSSMLVYHLFSK